MRVVVESVATGGKKQRLRERIACYPVLQLAGSVACVVAYLEGGDYHHADLNGRGQRGRGTEKKSKDSTAHATKQHGTTSYMGTGFL